MNNKQQVIGALKVLQNSYGVAASHKQNIAVARAIDIVEAVMIDSPAPALDWNPINITQMKPGQDYLLWGHKWSSPDVGFLTSAGYFISERTEAYDDERITYREADLTHYAEFNKPEGIE